MHHLLDSQSWSDVIPVHNLQWLKSSINMGHPQSYGASYYYHSYVQVHVVFVLILVKTSNTFVETVIKWLAKINQSFFEFWLFYWFFSPSFFCLDFWTLIISFQNTENLYILFYKINIQETSSCSELKVPKIKTMFILKGSP